MRVKPCPFAVFDEFGKPADDRVWAYAEVVAAAERESCVAIVRNAASYGCACSDRDALADVLMGEQQ